MKQMLQLQCQQFQMSVMQCRNMSHFQMMFKQCTRQRLSSRHWVWQFGILLCQPLRHTFLHHLLAVRQVVQIAPKGHELPVCLQSVGN